MSTQAQTDKSLEDKQKPAYAEDGTDLTLIRWMLSLTPEQRLLNLQSQARSLAMMRYAAKSF